MADSILKSVYDNQDEVPQQYADLFEERGGKFCFKRIEGLATQADVERLQRSVKAERDAHGVTKQSLQLVCGDQKPEEVRSILDQVPELQAKVSAGGNKLDDKKIEDLLHARLQQKVAPLERENAKLVAQLAERDAQLQSFAHEKAIRTIHDSVRTVVRGGPEGKGPKIVDSAEEDVLSLAERHFEIVDGRLQTKEGTPVPAGLDVPAWFQEISSKKPHWFGPTQGSGATGGKGFGGFANNPFTNESWNMTEQAKIVRTDPAKAEQMAKAAGTRVGGARPAPRGK